MKSSRWRRAKQDNETKTEKSMRARYLAPAYIQYLTGCCAGRVPIANSSVVRLFACLSVCLAGSPRVCVVNTTGQ